MMTPMVFRRLALPICALVLLGVAAPTWAQTPMDPLDARDARRLDRMEQVMRELRAIVFQGRDSGKPVVVQPAETDYQLQEMGRRVDEQEKALTRLNGQLETVTHDLDQARRDSDAQKAANQALNDRLTKLEQQAVAATAPPAPPPPEGSGGLAAQPGAPQAQNSAEAFTQARQLMLNGDYGAAEAAFQDYVARFGDTSKAPEARYWLGKTLTARSAQAEAASAYIGAIRGWPTTTWAPDAVVELSRALIALKKPTDACQALGELNRRYPKAAPAIQSRAAAARAQAKCAA
jgi:tol-pal system protein YbgF